MGKQQSKNAEVIIAQNGAGNQAQAELQRKLEVYSVVTIIVIIVISATCLYIFCRRAGKKVKGKVIEQIISSIEQGRGTQLAQTAARPDVQSASVHY